MLDPAANDTLGTFIRERNLTTTDRILIEKFVSLSVKARWEVLKFVLDIADALWEECSVSAQAGKGPDAGRQIADATPAHTENDIEQKVEEYRQRLIMEKNRKDTSSPSSEGDTETA